MLNDVLNFKESEKVKEKSIGSFSINNLLTPRKSPCLLSIYGEGNTISNTNIIIQPTKLYTYMYNVKLNYETKLRMVDQQEENSPF